MARRRTIGRACTRAKALAERAVGASGLCTTTLAGWLVYAPGDRRLLRIERLVLLPVVPLMRSGGARTQPIWADAVPDCVLRASTSAPPAASSWRAGRAHPS